jgi:hypothetical protein
MFALLRWTNPPQVIDSLRFVQVKATGDTVAATTYSSTSPLVTKRAGASGARDSAWISLSVANVVGPAAIRLHVFTHGPAGWSGPSNALSLFYAARDTFYLGPPGGGLATEGWWRGPRLCSYSQELGDATWADWRHQEVVQSAARAGLCRTYGYACRRGVRDTAWCVGQ